uniref:Uncharacterized protein n=1 Tax=Glossina pallidipes TaxID=7398 RepID=A0A1A9ZTN4_GLOPL
MRKSPEVLPDPFKRSTRIQRSPEKLGGKTMQERSRSSPPILQDKSLMIKKGENSFVKLGEKIGELIEMMAPTPSAPARRTIHQPMRDLVDVLAVLHKKAAKELGNQMRNKRALPLMLYLFSITLGFNSFVVSELTSLANKSLRFSCKNAIVNQCKTVHGVI